jgi:hypothetical protein
MAAFTCYRLAGRKPFEQKVMEITVPPAFLAVFNKLNGLQRYNMILHNTTGL